LPVGGLLIGLVLDAFPICFNSIGFSSRLTKA
jgi:hypothetical protein